MDAKLLKEMAEYADANTPIMAVKLVRQTFGLPLRDAKFYVDNGRGISNVDWQALTKKFEVDLWRKENASSFDRLLAAVNSAKESWPLFFKSEEEALAEFLKHWRM